MFQIYGPTEVEREGAGRHATPGALYEYYLTQPTLNQVANLIQQSGLYRRRFTRVSGYVRCIGNFASKDAAQTKTP